MENELMLADNENFEMQGKQVQMIPESMELGGVIEHFAPPSIAGNLTGGSWNNPINQFENGGITNESVNDFLLGRKLLWYQLGQEREEVYLITAARLAGPNESLFINLNNSAHEYNILPEDVRKFLNGEIVVFKNMDGSSLYGIQLKTSDTFKYDLGGIVQTYVSPALLQFENGGETNKNALMSLLEKYKDVIKEEEYKEPIIPIARTQFEEDTFEFADGGVIESMVAKEGDKVRHKAKNKEGVILEKNNSGFMVAFDDEPAMSCKANELEYFIIDLTDQKSKKKTNIVKSNKPPRNVQKTKKKTSETSKGKKKFIRKK